MSLNMTDGRGDTPLRVIQASAAFGVLWNAYGVYQFLGTLMKSPANLMSDGMTAEQAAAYLALPLWMTAAFAVGVFGGLLGSVLLFIRRRVAVPILVTSAIGYVILFSGNLAYGIFDALPTQFAIIVFVVAVAFALLAIAAYAEQHNVLH